MCPAEALLRSGRAAIRRAGGVFRVLLRAHDLLVRVALAALALCGEPAPPLAP